MIDETFANNIIRTITIAEASKAISEFEAMTCLGLVYRAMGCSSATDYFEMARVVARTDEETAMITEAEAVAQDDPRALLKALDRYTELFLQTKASQVN